MDLDRLVENNIIYKEETYQDAIKLVAYSLIKKAYDSNLLTENDLYKIKQQYNIVE